MKIEDVKSYIEQSMNGVDTIASELDELVSSIVDKTCKELDEYVQYVKALLDDQSRDISNIELDDIVMTLPTLLYFTGSVQETIGIREDIAKMNETNAVHEALANSSGTVQEKQAYAKTVTQTEALTTIVYQRANKQIKAKNEIALEVLQSCKKVLSRRLAESELSKNTPTRMQKG